MIRPSSTSTRAVLSCCPLLVLSLVVLIPAVPARAGIGNPLKKVKEKIEKKVESVEPETIDDNTVVFDDVVLELTGERLDRIIAAYQSAKAIDAGRPAAVARLNKAAEARGKIWDKHGESIMELQRRRDEIEVCCHDGYQEAQDRRTQEYQQKALTDPAIREKFAQAAAEYNAAAAKGDSVAIKKLQDVLMSETIISHDDSVAVQKKCGTKPPPTPPESQIADLDKEIAEATEAIRSIDEKIAEAQAKDVQMNREQLAMAVERIQMFLASKASKPPREPRGFSDGELDAMEKRLGNLRGALGS